MVHPISHYATGDGKTSCGLDASKVSISNMADCVECLYQELKELAPKLYSFLSPGDIMAEGDEMIEPWFTWRPIPKHNIGGNVSAKGAPRVRRPFILKGAMK